MLLAIFVVTTTAAAAAMRAKVAALEAHLAAANKGAGVSLRDAAPSGVTVGTAPTAV